MQHSSLRQNSFKNNHANVTSYMDHTASSSVKQFLTNTRQKSKNSSKRIKLDHVYSSRTMNTRHQPNFQNSQKHIPTTHPHKKPNSKTTQITTSYKTSNENKNTINNSHSYNKPTNTKLQNKKQITSSHPTANKTYNSTTQINRKKNQSKKNYDIKNSNQYIKNILHEKNMKEQNYPKNKKKKSNGIVNKTINKMTKKAKKRFSKDLPFKNKVFYNPDNDLLYIDYRFSDYEDDPNDHKNLEWNTHNDPFDDSFHEYSDEYVSSNYNAQNCNF